MQMRETSRVQDKKLVVNNKKWNIIKKYPLFRASSQYGGQSFSLAHLAPFIDVSRRKFRQEVIEERKELGESIDDEIVEKIVERRLRKEVISGIQTIQYQLITLQTTNGRWKLGRFKNW